MKKHSKNHTVSLKDKDKSQVYSGKIRDLISDTLPRDIIGMLATAKEANETMVFNNRWHLGADDRNDYYIYDSYTKTHVYKNIALFSSAVKMLWFMDRPLGKHVTTDRIIYSLDQQYYRCLEDIKFFKSKIASKPSDAELYKHRLSQSRYRLEDIKTEISKIY